MYTSKTTYGKRWKAKLAGSENGWFGNLVKLMIKSLLKKRVLKGQTCSGSTSFK